jgi:hypothetical protein
MAEYCAWRAGQFGVSHADSTELETMARVNHEREFGNPLELRLPVERAVVADGRMLPHEWFCASDGRWLKLDAAAHGDDHFFPGPCDIAWDLAGVSIEWELDSDVRQQFLSQYARVSGDDVNSRIAGYEAAYAVSRLAWSKMAAASAQGSADEERLLRDYSRYRNAMMRLSNQQSLSCGGSSGS